jgi:hypothetical protein
MAEIICAECKSHVSDDPGYCTECGFPFEKSQTIEENNTATSAESVAPNTIVTTPLDIILQSLNSVGTEIRELRNIIAVNQSDLNSRLMAAENETNTTLTEIAVKLDTIVTAQSAMMTSTRPDSPKKTKKELLAAFYKTLNSPNSMFEYMFYICVVQLVFVIVNLFLVTYIATLVRK